VLPLPALAALLPALAALLLALAALLLPLVALPVAVLVAGGRTWVLLVAGSAAVLVRLAVGSAVVLLVLVAGSAVVLVVLVAGSVERGWSQAVVASGRLLLAMQIPPVGNHCYRATPHNTCQHVIFCRAKKSTATCKKAPVSFRNFALIVGHRSSSWMN
jgi:hypothetical protein